MALGTNIAVLLDCSKSSRQCSLFLLLTYFILLLTREGIARGRSACKPMTSVLFTLGSVTRVGVRGCQGGNNVIIRRATPRRFPPASQKKIDKLGERRQPTKYPHLALQLLPRMHHAQHAHQWASHALKDVRANGTLSCWRGFSLFFAAPSIRWLAACAASVDLTSASPVLS